MPRGRPSVFTESLGLGICTRIANGELLTAICKDPGMPSRATVVRWALDGKHEGFFQSYARAMQARADYWAEQMVEIADDGSRDYVTSDDGKGFVDHDHIARSRLRVDARKFLIAKHDPERYGDRQTIDINARGQRRISEMSNDEILEELEMLRDERLPAGAFPSASVAAPEVSGE